MMRAGIRSRFVEEGGCMSNVVSFALGFYDWMEKSKKTFLDPHWIKK